MARRHMKGTNALPLPQQIRDRVEQYENLCRALRRVQNVDILSPTYINREIFLSEALKYRKSLLASVKKMAGFEGMRHMELAGNAKPIIDMEAHLITATRIIEGKEENGGIVVDNVWTTPLEQHFEGIKDCTGYFAGWVDVIEHDDEPLRRV